MIVFTWIAQAITGISLILSYPITFLGGLSIMQIGVAMCAVTMINRFLLKPLFGRHKQDSATEKNRKGKNE